MQHITELIRSETPAAVRETLEFMLYECSLDQAPDAADVGQWRGILTQRGGKFLPLAQMCADCLAEEGA